MSTSKYVNECRRNYSLMVLTQRALPSFADGMTTAARRLLWVSNKIGKQKTAALAGSTLYLHPHAEPTEPVKTMAGKFTNNYPLLKGYGSWGTRLDPDGIASPRYTSVAISDFCKDAVLADLDLVEMVPNYDKTATEPKHFLPLVPPMLVNPFFGIAVGYSSTILPRSLSDVIDSQIKHLEDKKERKIVPITFLPLNAQSVDCIQDPENPHKTKWIFHGTFKWLSARKIKITELPYGKYHEPYRKKLQELKDLGAIRDFQDDSSKQIDITITVPTKKQLHDAGLSNKVSFDTDQNTIEALHLENSIWENLNVINPEQTGVMSLSYNEMIAQFTDWRTNWYKLRFEKRLTAVQHELARLNDVLLAIENGANAKSSKCKNRATFRTWLTSIGVKDTDYISSLPTYRFVKEEKQRLVDEIAKKIKEVEDLENKINHRSEHVKAYISDLVDLKKRYK